MGQLMARCGAVCFLCVVCCAWLATAGESIIVREDGSVTGRFGPGSSRGQLTVLKFGLPRLAPVKMWHEGPVLRSLWVTNGILYTQTAFVTTLGRGTASSGEAVASNLVLVVNIRGENTNSEYAEAQAELAVETEGMALELELSDGAVWESKSGSKVMIGAFEIPESGVQLSHGKVLRFSGNMPPSLNGSMTLKVPLVPCPDHGQPEWLRDMDFEAELRRVLRSAGTSTADGLKRPMRFASEGLDNGPPGLTPRHGD